MKKLFIFLFLLLLTTQIYAQVFEVKKSVACTTIENIEKMLKQEGEKLLWQAKDIDNGNLVSIYVNELTSTWTLIESNKKVACIVSVGQGFEIVFKSKFL